jgi:hypothetical protein
MPANTQEAVLSAYIASLGKRTPLQSAHDAAELCKLANSLNRLNEVACNCGLSERQEKRKQNLQRQVKAVLGRAGLVLNHFENDPRGFAVYVDLPDGSYNSFGGREHVVPNQVPCSDPDRGPSNCAQHYAMCWPNPAVSAMWQTALPEIRTEKSAGSWGAKKPPETLCWYGFV